MTMTDNDISNFILLFDLFIYFFTAFDLFILAEKKRSGYWHVAYNFIFIKDVSYSIWPKKKE